MQDENREVSVVIDGRITMGCLCPTYTPVSTIEFCFREGQFQSVSEVSKFRINSLSLVYHCAIHNLPTFGDRTPSSEMVNNGI